MKLRVIRIDQENNRFELLDEETGEIYYFMPRSFSVSQYKEGQVIMLTIDGFVLEVA